VVTFLFEYETFSKGISQQIHFAHDNVSYSIFDFRILEFGMLFRNFGGDTQPAQINVN